MISFFRVLMEICIYFLNIEYLQKFDIYHKLIRRLLVGKNMTTESPCSSAVCLNRWSAQSLACRMVLFSPLPTGNFVPEGERYKISCHPFKKCRELKNVTS